MRQPKWKESYRVERLEPDLVFLLSERGHYVLNGRTYYEMAPYLDGQHSVGDIVRQVNGGTSFLQISQALARIKKKGYVVESEEELPAEISLLCHTLGIDTAVARQRLGQTHIRVNSLKGLGEEGLVERLQRAGMQVSTGEGEADLEVVLSSNYLEAELAEYNARNLDRKRPWLLVQPVGTVLQIGPLFQPGATGCWACLSQRQRLHRRVERFLQHKLGGENGAGRAGKNGTLPVPLSSFTPLMEIGLNWAVLELLKWVLTGENENLGGHVTTIDIHTRELKQHVFVRRPQCAVCGDGGMIARRAQQPIRLQPQPKLFTADGGHRVRPPEETVAAFEHHVSCVTGILEVLRKVDSDGDGLIHSYYAGVNVQYTPQTYNSLRTMFKSVDGGKGASDMQSKASGLCEALERYSACYQGNEYTIKATYTELGDQAIHPNICMNFSEKQYENAAEWNKQPHLENFNRVPPRFDESAKIDWTPVWSLTEETFKYLPTTYCYFGVSKEILSTSPCSNGNAAGNTLEEAILQGFLEMVERDSVALWWYNRVQRPCVDLASFAHPYITRLQTYYESLNRNLWVLDLSSDLNIPVFAAISSLRESDKEKIIFGFGAHFDPQIALLRSLTEVNQCLSMFLKSIEEGQMAITEAGEANSWWNTATVANQPYLSPLPGVSARQREDFPRLWHEDLMDDVMACVQIARQQGMETLVLDQTQPDVGLHTVKVFVPGLRHFWRRLGPGRLYDVPVKLGWLSAPLQEEDMNPFSMFL